MALEDKNAQHYGEVVDKFVDPVVNYQMTTYDYVVRPGAEADETVTITLPPVAEAKGRIYSIIARTIGARGAVVIEDKDDSECWPGDITLSTKCDSALLYSDGLAWLVFTSITQPS